MVDRNPRVRQIYREGRLMVVQVWEGGRGWGEAKKYGFIFGIMKIF